MLLTDDRSTIDEIQEHHPNYNWIYLDRPRAQGVASGWQGHIPSGDEAFEVLAIYTEIQLASDCQTVIQGQSGFMKMLLGKMEMEGKRYQRHIVHTGVEKDEAVKWPGDGVERVRYFMKRMEEYRRKSRESKHNTTRL
jgi:hypothetical protein